MKKKLLPLLLCSLVLSVFTGFAQVGTWQKSTSSGSLNSIAIDQLNEKSYEIYQLNFEAFKQNLVNAPLRDGSQMSNVVISIPNEKGGMENFTILEAPVLDAALSARFPNIKSYVGSNRDGAHLRMSVTPKGVQTMISYVDKSTVFMQPVDGDSQKYIAYSREARGNAYKEDFICSTIEEYNKYATDGSFEVTRDADDQTLRIFRLAMSVNGEYTQFHGGTVAGAIAAINATMTRVNAVFEVDMAVTYIVVDAPELIFTDAATDPYSNNLADWNVQLQNTLTNTIGNAAYDIGHMFGASGGGGNAGCIGCVCRDDTPSTTDRNKGSGITSPADAIPQGDTFDIDYVAHEIGHQMGANHTFAFNTEGSGVNSEPGSGSTVMAYAGITGPNNVQLNSDPYFHYHSIRQILNNLNVRTCWQANSPVTITNAPPSADAGADFVIPRGTAYVLRGAATDADPSDILTYCWEQTDSGVVTNTTFGPNLAAGSMNRSLPPTLTEDRYIPKLSRVVTGNLTQTNPTINTAWETVSNVARTMSWALTVRDRVPTDTGLNGQTSFDLMSITVDGNSGPFLVTSQASEVIWEVGATKEVTWDVANTASAPINTPNVNILLSTDGGVTFPVALATNVPNNGSYNVTVPSNVTSQARIIVEGSENIFYAMNSSNFSIIEAEFVINFASTEVNVCQPDNAAYTFTYNTFLGFNGSTTFSASNVPAGATVTFSPESATADGTDVTMTVSNTTAVDLGTYTITVTGTSGAITADQDVTLTVYSDTIASSTLLTPANGETGVSSETNLTWNEDVNAENYFVEVATDAAFTNVINSATVSVASFTTSLNSNTLYYWRVTASNECATAAPSETRSFTTAEITCATYSAADTPIPIPAVAATRNSFISINQDFAISDVNVFIDIVHTYVSDLDVILISPIGTEIELTSGNGGTADNYTNTLFDQDATTPITAGAPPYTGTFRPEGNLSLLNGESTLGIWTLRVVDNFNLDGGSIQEFRLDLCVQGTLGVEELTFSDFVIFPNPNKGDFTIKMNSNTGSNIKVEVYDISGRSIFNSIFENTSAFKQTINLNNAQSGMYLVKITDGEKSATKKIIVE